MQIEIDNNYYNVEIVKKVNTKNTYIRVKDDLTIYVTTNILTSSRKVSKILTDNVTSIKRMIDNVIKRQNYNNKFHYLGKEYDIVRINDNIVSFHNDKVFIGKRIDIDKFLRKRAKDIFSDRLNYWYQNFSVSIEKPSLTIRTMKSRWGVCNTKTKRVTLNLELIKRSPEELDYVIVHELSHLVHTNHSKNFWSLVEENYKEYKKVRKKLKSY